MTKPAVPVVDYRKKRFHATSVLMVLLSPLGDTLGLIKSGRRSLFRYWPDWCCAIGCAATMLIALEQGHEGSFYELSTIMHQPAMANAAFGYRLLLPSLAVGLEGVRRSLTDHNAFIATQILAIVAAVV